MFFSAAFQAATVNGRPRLHKTTFFVNLGLAGFLLAVLLPRLVWGSFSTDYFFLLVVVVVVVFWISLTNV